MTPEWATELGDAIEQRIAGDYGADLTRLRAAVRRLSTAVAVVVHGRPGSGVSTVAAALTAAGVPVADTGDINLRVIVEVLKPEDEAALTDQDQQAVVVLNKADLFRWRGNDPLAIARRRCVQEAIRSGRPVVPLAGLVAVAALDTAIIDDATVAVLRRFVTDPADLRTPDTFVETPHMVSRETRVQLLAQLDLFGLAHAVALIRHDPAATAAQIRTLLRAVSGIDPVCAAITDTAAQVRYRRLDSVLTAMHTAALHTPAIAELCAGPAIASIRMRAAADVLHAIDTVDRVEALHHRAVYWQRYRCGPVNALHRACATDMVRGALSLIAQNAS